jgi:hypothetical protein
MEVAEASFSDLFRTQSGMRWLQTQGSMQQIGGSPCSLTMATASFNTLSPAESKMRGGEGIVEHDQHASCPGVANWEFSQQV